MDVQPASWDHKALKYARYPGGPLPANLRRWLCGLTQLEIRHAGRQASGRDTMVGHYHKARQSLKQATPRETVQGGSESQLIASLGPRSL